MIDAVQIQLQIMILEAQKTGIEKQIQELQQMKCPVCKGAREFMYAGGKSEVRN